jgi:hypothetical protein
VEFQDDLVLALLEGTRDPPAAGRAGSLEVYRKGLIASAVSSLRLAKRLQRRIMCAAGALQAQGLSGRDRLLEGGGIDRQIRDSLLGSKAYWKYAG